MLSEPGRDTTRFDTLAPTVVKPLTREAYSGDQPQVTAAPMVTAVLSPWLPPCCRHGYHQCALGYSRSVAMVAGRSVAMTTAVLSPW